MSSSKLKMRSRAFIGIAALLACCCWAAPALAQNQFQTLYERVEATIGSQPAEAEKAGRAYLAAARRQGNALLTMIGYSLVGRALAARDRLTEAEECFAAGVAISKKVPDDKNARILIAALLFERGYNYSNLGKHELAIETLTNVAARLEQLPNPGASDLWKTLYVISEAQVTLARFDEAESTLQRMDNAIALESPESARKRSYYLGSMSRLRLNQFRIEEAEQFCRRELEKTIEWVGPDSQYTGHAWNCLGILLTRQYRFHEAEQAHQKAATIVRAARGEQSLQMANVYKALGSLYRLQGRYAEAELHYHRALAIRRKILGPNHPTTIETGPPLALLYELQNRTSEALPYYRAAYESYLETRGRGHPRTQKALGSYCACLISLGQWDTAENILVEAMKIHGPEAYESLGHVQVLIKLYERQQRYADAEKLILQSIATQKRLPKAQTQGAFLAYEYDALGLVYFGLGRYAEARDSISTAIEIYEADAVYQTALAQSYAKRAKCSWELNDLDAVQADLDKAMELADQRRVRISGTDQNRSEAFVELAIIFEYAVKLQFQRGDAEAALAAMERGRARSLLDQMAVQGIDLLAGVEPALAGQLRDRKAKALFAITSIEGDLEKLADDKALAGAARQARRDQLVGRLRSAQAAYAAVEADIRNASPAYRLAVGRNFQPVAVDDLQSYVDEQNALLLRYFVGGTGVYLFVLAGDQPPRLFTLDVSEDLAQALGADAGPLIASSLNRMLTNSQKTGALQRLRAARGAQGEAAAVPVLHGLWRLLIPEPQRQQLANQQFERLIVIPDGALAMLPLEALVVGAEGEPTYLLDVGPPILYAPSASILYNLARAEQRAKAASVLSVGDPSYGDAPSDGGAVASGRSRYYAAGGKLSRLPYSGLEASWVEEIFSKSQLAVQRLVGAAATERAIRAAMRNKSVIHLACHGITDQALGNLFGALAFAPGAARGDSTDDGVLSLGEIYELDLAGCELTILSACDTNIGPTQHGEGVWALSRGFLVAGAKRVVASNWVVDDKAAASLISYYCSFLARAEAKGKTPDYAKSLRDARRWVRGQELWRSPYYWATFVHVGSN